MSKRPNSNIGRKPYKRQKKNNKIDIHQLNQKDHLGNTALHNAILQENDREVTKLLQLNVEVNTAGYFQYSALQLAVKSQKESYVKALLNAEADINHRNVAGQTALHEASCPKICNKAAGNIMQLLLANQAYMNATDVQGKTPLHYACAQLQWIRGITALLAFGANTSSKDNDGHTPLQIALNENCRNTTAAALLLMHGVEDDINAQDSKGATFLHYAVSSTDVLLSSTLITKLVEMGADVSARNALGQTPLHLACEEVNDLAAAFTLLDVGAGVDVNVQDYRGKTPLHLAAANQCLQAPMLIEKFLAEHWGAIDVLDNNGETPIDIALSDPINRLRKQVIFTEHAFKLKCVNLFHCQTYEFNFKFIGKGMKSQCLKELEAMKKTKSGRHTLLDIFTNQHDPVYLKNQKLVKLYESKIAAPTFKRKFPMYKDVIVKTLKKNKRRFELLGKADECFKNIYISEVKRYIFKYLDEQDLVNLITGLATEN